VTVNSGIFGTLTSLTSLLRRYYRNIIEGTTSLLAYCHRRGLLRSQWCSLQWVADRTVLRSTWSSRSPSCSWRVYSSHVYGSSSMSCFHPSRLVYCECSRLSLHPSYPWPLHRTATLIVQSCQLVLWTTATVASTTMGRSSWGSSSELANRVQHCQSSSSSSS
jgi:hypothetical protein